MGSLSIPISPLSSSTLHLRRPSPSISTFPSKTLTPAIRSRRSPISTPPRSLRRTVPSAMACVSSKPIQGGELLVFGSEEELAPKLAEYVVELSEKFAKERGAFTVVLSGGSLIKSMRKLTESPYSEKVDWGKWHVFWVDERVVPKDHVDSNYKLAYDGFLSKVPIPSGQVYAINDSLSAEGAADDYETCLRQLVKTSVVDLTTDGLPKFDLMLLGMGPDGHVASLFPGHPLLNEKERWVTFIKDSPKPPPERITFTFPVINVSANIAMVVAGAGKADAVGRSLGSEQGSSEVLPVQMVTLKDGKLTWFTDEAAVSKL